MHTVQKRSATENLNWDDVRVFLVLSRTGTFAGAARELGVNATTAARRLAALEHSVGAQLFTRSPDGLIATAAAQAILEPAELIERQTQRIARTVGGEDARLAGSVRLAVSPSFATDFLVDHLASFRRKHPDIELELNTSNAMVDLTRGEAEIGVRFRAAGVGPAASAGPIEVIAQRSTSIGIAVYGARSYFERVGWPRDAYDVDGHDVIGATESASYLPGSNWTTAIGSRAHVALRADSVAAVGAAAAAGFGLCAIPSFVALRHDNLLRVVKPDVVDGRDIWMLMPGDLKRVARVRAVWEFLTELFTTWEPLLSGRVVPEGRLARPT